MDSLYRKGVSEENRLLQTIPGEWDPVATILAEMGPDLVANRTHT